MDKKYSLSLPQLIAVAATRGMAGAGIGLLLSNRLSRRQRRALGLPLFLAGALSTIPIALHVFGKGCSKSEN